MRPFGRVRCILESMRREEAISTLRSFLPAIQRDFGVRRISLFGPRPRRGSRRQRPGPPRRLRRRPDVRFLHGPQVLPGGPSRPKGGNRHAASLKPRCVLWWSARHGCRLVPAIGDSDMEPSKVPIPSAMVRRRRSRGLPRDHADDIIESCGRIGNSSRDDLEAFVADRRTCDAVIRNIEVIGEAAKNLPTTSSPRRLRWSGARFAECATFSRTGIRLDTEGGLEHATTKLDELEERSRPAR